METSAAWLGWEARRRDIRLRESQPVSFREKDKTWSSKGARKGLEKDGRIIRVGRGRPNRNDGDAVADAVAAAAADDDDEVERRRKGTGQREANVAGERGREAKGGKEV